MLRDLIQPFLQTLFAGKEVYVCRLYVLVLVGSSFFLGPITFQLVELSRNLGLGLGLGLEILMRPI